MADGVLVIREHNADLGELTKLFGVLGPQLEV
jgi:hypothetical protein